MSIEAELVQRYGRGILAIERKDIPPRRARSKHQLAVIPSVGRRNKLVKEIKQAGHKAHVARHRVTKEVPANLVFTNALPAFAKHARSVLAEIPTREIVRLYGNRPPAPVKVLAPAFRIGDLIKVINGHLNGKTGQLIGRRGRAWRADIEGKTFCLTPNNFVHFDPG